MLCYPYFHGNSVSVYTAVYFPVLWGVPPAVYSYYNAITGDFCDSVPNATLSRAQPRLSSPVSGCACCRPLMTERPAAPGRAPLALAGVAAAQGAS